MRRVLPLFILVLFGSMLFADQWIDKHHKYGTTPVEYEPVPAYVNPEYINSYRNSVVITVGGGSYDSEISWTLTATSSGDVIASGGAPYEEAATMPDGFYTLSAVDSWGDGWNGAYFTVTDAATGDVYFSYTLATGTDAEELFGINAVNGCTDATACNYNENATDDLDDAC